MPPKSANRSGKSTPTKGQSRGGDKDKRKDDDDKQQQEEEEARLKAEQEEKERLEREQKEREELAKLEALEESRREQELGETEQKIRELKKYVEKLDGDRRANAMWERYMRCDGSPDPTVLKQINTFINLKKETGKPDINVILDEAKDIYELIDELKFLMEDTPAEEKNHETDEQYRSTILALQDLVMHRYGEGIMKILKEAIYEADSESGNLQKVIKGENEIIMLWGNLNKNPRFKSFTFEGENFAFELPKPLALADVAVRNLWSFRDHYSNQCSTFYPKAKKIKPTDEPADKKEEVKPEGEESEKLEVEQGEVAAADDEETKSTATDGRKSALSETAESEKKQEKEGEEEETNKDDASNPPVENQADEEEEEELDDILDEDVVDLRQFQQLGGIYHIDLIKLPPQPLSVKGWTLRQVIDEPMTLIEYPSEAFAPKPTSRAASAKDDARDTESPSKPQEQSQPPVTVIIMLPKNVMFFEEPQIANWDPIDSHWKTSGITDTTFDEENRSLTFKSRHFGTFCLTQDSHLNMPFQMWELRPLGLNHVLFTITAAIAETMIEIKGTQCRLQTPTDDPPTELEHLYEKWMCARDLKLALQTSGVNMFPAEDSHKFVSIQEKTLDLDGLYDQMALLSTSFAFSWSKWNSTVSKSQVVMQAAPWLGFGDAREKDTATPTYPPVPSPPTLSDDDWSEFYIDEKRSYKMAITELDDDFKSSLAPGAEYHSDFFHAVRDTPFPEPGPSQQGKPSRQKVLNRISTVDKQFVNTVQTLLKGTKIITYS